LRPQTFVCLVVPFLALLGIRISSVRWILLLPTSYFW
jgi:hypothetical protein